MPSLAELETDLAEQHELIDNCKILLEDGTDKELMLEEIAEAEKRIASLKTQIAALKKDDKIPPPPPSDAKAPAPAVVYNVGDSIQAKYSADKLWYAATITGKMGSSADPMYTVHFTDYGNSETKRAHEIRPASPPDHKRKADAISDAAPPPPPPPSLPITVSDGTVITAAPIIDPSKIGEKRDASKIGDGPARPAAVYKKLKGNRTLKKEQNSWKDFQKNGPKKPVTAGPKSNFKKESQFRTNDGANARVGFTNSGRPMQKDQVRTPWKYDKTETVDEDD